MRTLEYKTQKKCSLEEVVEALPGLEYQSWEGGPPPLIGCIDDRMSKIGDKTEYAVPGGGPGIFIEACATLHVRGVDVVKRIVEIRNTIVEVLGGIEKFCMHTDQLHGPGICAGCGHVANVFTNPEDYGITYEIVGALKEQLGWLKENGAVYQTYYGEHDPKAVLVLKGDLSLAHADLDSKFFVFNTDVAEELGNKSAKALAKGFEIEEEVIWQTVKAAKKSHFDATAQKLAKGLPVFRVRKEGNKLVATPA